MFYPSYDDYMRDIFYYNGLAGNNMGMQPNQNMAGYMTGPMCMNNGYMSGMQNNGNNINNLYPSIYRIVYPVVQKVTSENNFPIINDEVITNTTDTIYNIVEGDLNSAQNSTQNCNSNTSIQRSTSNSNNSNTSSSSSNNQNMQSSSYSAANSSNSSRSK